jgi:hypothetical protein
MNQLVRCFILLLLGFVGSANAQKTAYFQAYTRLTYADLADLSLPASLVAEVRVRGAEIIKGPLAATAPTGHQRYLISAEVVRLIRGTGGLDPRITYVFDAPRDSRGQFPKLKKMQMIVFAVPVPNRSGEIRLIAPDAQILATPENVQKVRAILSAAMRSDAPPRVTGVGDAFHVAGQVPGEGETQIFLLTADDRPISFSVTRSQSKAPTWSVSSGEIVDDTLSIPARDTLLWYRLSCALPLQLPPTSRAALSADVARIVSEDYHTVMTGLGNCPRSRVNRP